MFKIVYVLTSSKKDYYYNQLLISLVSLRNNMPSQAVEVIVDQNTYETLTDGREEIFQYAKIIKVDVDDRYSQKERSRFLKTSLRNIIQGDFLFIDCDTVICSDFSDFYTDKPIAMVLDRNCLMSERDDHGTSIFEVGNRCGFNLRECEKYFNSGVMWVRDTTETHEFFEEWNCFWKKTLKIGMCVDQPSLNYVNMKRGLVIGELDGIWNCQVTLRPAGVKYISGAYIMHYFNTNLSSPYLLCDEAAIREGLSNPVVQKVIENPRGAFKQSYLITMNSDVDYILESKCFRFLLKIYRKANGIYKALEKIFELGSKISGAVKKEKNWNKY